MKRNRDRYKGFVETSFVIWIFEVFAETFVAISVSFHFFNNLALTSSTARFSAPGVSVSRREKIPSSRKRLLAKNAQNLNTKSIIQTQARRRVLAKKREIAYSKKYPGSPVFNGVGAAANEEDLSLQNRSARIKYL